MSAGEPSYVALHRSGELIERAERALSLLGPERCTVCPRECKVDRLSDRPGLCKVGRHAVVASHFPHFGEEDCLRGWNGSGTIFFSGCNLRCVFCLPPGTLVATDRGPRAIDEIFQDASSEISVGDGRARRPDDVRVYTITGELASTSKAFRHRCEGELIRLKPMSAPELRLTPNHGVFAVHRADPGRIVKVPAGSLTEDHYLVSPPIRRRSRRGGDSALVPALAAQHSSAEVGKQLLDRPARVWGDRFNGSPEPQEWAGWRDEGSHFLVPIHRIDREPYEGDVYNLEVDHPSHSYLAPAVAVANCQNHDISWQLSGERAGPERLASMMLELQAIGCHNINWVTPEHVVPQILEALPLAVEGGLRLPIIYNTSAYDSPDSLELMDGIVSVYMPDLKLMSTEGARRYLGKREYAEVMQQNVKEMHRQVGDLVLDERGLARRGMILRHLVMPGMLDETEAVLRFVAEEIGPGAYVNVMGQYYPAGKTDKYEEINRRPHREELERAFEIADELGLRRLDPRSRRDAVGTA